MNAAGQPVGRQRGGSDAWDSVPGELRYPTTDMEDYEFEWYGGTEYAATKVQMTIVRNP
jgi:hypothetical protein